MRAQKAHLMRNVSLIVLLCVIASSDALANEAAALKVFREWLGAYNSGNEARIAAFWEKYGGARQPDDRVALDIRRHDVTGDMIIARIAEESPTHIVAVMKESHGNCSESTVDLVSAYPPVIARIVGHPVPSSANLPSRAANDADLV